MVGKDIESIITHLDEQNQLHEARLQAIEHDALVAPARDTSILNLILRLDSIITASIEERNGLMNTILELQKTVENQSQKIEHLSAENGNKETHQKHRS